MTYDPVNRMTHPSFRKKDDTRASDHTQVLGNMEAVDALIAEGHDANTGAHGPVDIEDLFGYAARDGLGVDQVPPDVDDFALHLVLAPGPVVQVGFFQAVDVGADVAGLYELELTFGGDRQWSVHVGIERVE